MGRASVRRHRKKSLVAGSKVVLAESAEEYNFQEVGGPKPPKDK
jgi:hypothetical protein